MGGAANGLANEDAFSGVPRQVSIYGTSGSNRDTLYGILQTFGMGSTSQRNGVISYRVSSQPRGIYERSLIEEWIRGRRQRNQPITSPCTGLVLSSTDLMPVLALQRAIETYLANRPELKEMQMARRSYEEAAQMLQDELLEQQAMHQSIHDELARL